MRRLFLGAAFMAATVPLDLACSKDEDPKSSVNLGDGDGDGDIDVGTGGGMGDGDGDGDVGQPATCPEFIGLPSCNEEGRTATRRNVNLLLVIDKSGSMDDDGGFDNSKWDTMKAALEGSLQEVAPEINVGLSLYPFPDDVAFGIDKDTCGEVGNCCEMPTDTEPNIAIGPGLVTVPEIVDSFDRVRPGGGTPTAVALESAYDYFVNGTGAELEGDNYVILATDGGPNCNADITCEAEGCTRNIDARDASCTLETASCCGGNQAISCLDDEASRDAVSRLGSAGIDTFVIGVPGTEAYASVLDSLAEEGGRALVGEDQQYFAVDGAAGVDGLIDVFRRITEDLVTSCDIQLSETPESVSEGDINVAVDCEVIPQFAEETGNGGAGGEGSGEEQWFLDGVTDPPTIRLRGALCDRIQEEGVDRVDVILGCPSVQ